MSDSLWPHGLQHARPPCPSSIPGVHSNLCPFSRWCHPTISSSAIPFSHLQSFPASGSFPMHQSLSHVQLFMTPWTAAHQPSLSITNSRSLLKLMSIQSAMPSNHLILWSSTSPPAFNLSQLLTNQICQNIKVAYFRNASLFWHSKKKKSRQFAILTESRRRMICCLQQI